MRAPKTKTEQQEAYYALGKGNRSNENCNKQCAKDRPEDRVRVRARKSKHTKCTKQTSSNVQHAKPRGRDPVQAFKCASTPSKDPTLLPPLQHRRKSNGGIAHGAESIAEETTAERATQCEHRKVTPIGRQSYSWYTGPPGVCNDSVLHTPEAREADTMPTIGRATQHQQMFQLEANRAGLWIRLLFDLWLSQERPEGVVLVLPPFAAALLPFTATALIQRLALHSNKRAVIARAVGAPG